MAINIPGVTFTSVKKVPKFAPAKNDGPAYEDEQQPISARKPSSSRLPIDVDDIPVGPGAQQQDYGYNNYDEEDPTDRPIRPKAKADYNDLDPNIGEVDNGHVMPQEVFPPGQHPLEGLPNILELPTPEPLNAKAK